MHGPSLALLRPLDVLQTDGGRDFCDDSGRGGVSIGVRAL